MKYIATVVGIAAGLTMMSGPASAAPTILGGLYFNTPGGINYFDPVSAPPFGGVPAGFGNVAGTSVMIGNGIEFGYQDVINRDTADFTGNTLTITNVTFPSDAFPFFMAFTSDVPGYFNNARFVSNSFGASLAVSGNSLIFAAPAFQTTGIRSATITFAGAAVPEPATWAMMIAGFGLVGATMRRSRTNLRISYSR